MELILICLYKSPLTPHCFEVPKNMVIPVQDMGDYRVIYIKGVGAVSVVESMDYLVDMTGIDPRK